MTSSVSICSIALIALGDSPIASFDEDTDRARACSNSYATVRDAALRAHPWKCATKRVLLSPLSTAPAFDFRFQYQLPSDWLKTTQVGRIRDYVPPYQTEGQRILCDLPSLPLVYIWRNTTESTWDGLFIDVMVAAIQAQIAYAITKSAAMMQASQQNFNTVLKSAKAVNGQDDPPETFGDFPLIESRVSQRRIVPGR